MRILVRADAHGWAFSRRAGAYACYAPDGWDVQVEHPDRSRDSDIWDAVFLLDCHASPVAYGDVQYARLMASHCWLHDPDPDDWRTRGCNNNRCRSKRERVFGRAPVVAVYNRQQLECAAEMPQHRFVLAPYCPDCSIFRPWQRRRTDKLRVGWCYQVSGGLNSFKGLSDVLVPLVAVLGDSVDWSVLTPQAGSALNTAELADWYNSIDVFLCTSSAEGGPQGPFEAAASGCVVVSTDVGQVSDWQTLRDMNLIVPTYRNPSSAETTVRCMAATIRALDDDRELLEACSAALVGDIRDHWSAEQECPKQLTEIFG